MLATEMAVISNGQIVQLGEPGDIYLSPKNTFVASFLGKHNVVRGKLRNIMSDGLVGQVDAGWESIWQGVNRTEAKINSSVVYIINPGHVSIEGDGNCRVEGEFRASEWSGLNLVKYFGLRSGIEIRSTVYCPHGKDAKPLTKGEKVKSVWSSKDGSVVLP